MELLIERDQPQMTEDHPVEEMKDPFADFLFGSLDNSLIPYEGALGGR